MPAFSVWYCKAITSPVGHIMWLSLWRFWALEDKKIRVSNRKQWAELEKKPPANLRSDTGKIQPLQRDTGMVYLHLQEANNPWQRWPFWSELLPIGQNHSLCSVQQVSIGAWQHIGAPWKILQICCGCMEYRSQKLVKTLPAETPTTLYCRQLPLKQSCWTQKSLPEASSDITIEKTSRVIVAWEEKHG